MNDNQRDDTERDDSHRGAARAERPGSGRLGRAALAAAAAGHFVFPLHPRSKFPAVEAWEQAASRDPETIAAWWSTRPYNIGAAVGRAGLVVIDLDEGDGEIAPERWRGARGGRDVLAQLAREADAPFPTGTYTVATPGGMHLYFRSPAGLALRNTQGDQGNGLGWKVDVRAHGGYIVAAGSVRPEGYYRAVNRAPIVELPGWLAAALTPPPAPPRVPTPPLQLPGGRAAAYVRAIVEGEAAKVLEATHGCRRSTLLASARTLGRIVGGGSLDEQEAERALAAAAGVHVGTHQFTTAEVDRTIRDGLAFGMRAPRRIECEDGQR